MTIYYSALTRGFYASDVHGKKGEPGSFVPQDALEISEAKYQELFDAQANGKIIVPDEEGRPVAVTRPPQAPTLESVKAQAKALLAECDWTQLADVDAATRTSFAPYRSLLREIIAQTTDPAAVIWPEPPTT